MKSYLYCIISFIAVITLITSCNQRTINGQKKQDTYQIGKIDNIQRFYTYNDEEKQLESHYLDFDKTVLLEKKDFKNNRARISMKNYENEKSDEHIEQTDTELPTLCDCFLENDTLTVRAGIGFFGGLGFLINIFNDTYEACYFEYTDDIEPYKTNLSDKDFSSHVIVKSKSQHLILDRQPNFQTGQQITGFLKFESKPYYIRRGLSPESEIDSAFVTGKIYFTCNTRRKTIWD